MEAQYGKVQAEIAADEKYRHGTGETQLPGLLNQTKEQLVLTKINRHKQRCHYLELVFKTIMLWVISYTGFIRLLNYKKKFQIPIVMGHVFELISQNIPLLLLQMYINDQGAVYVPSLSGKSDPNDYWNMNLVFSILNAADLLIECFYE